MGVQIPSSHQPPITSLPSEWGAVTPHPPSIHPSVSSSCNEHESNSGQVPKQLNFFLLRPSKELCSAESDCNEVPSVQAWQIGSCRPLNNDQTSNSPQCWRTTVATQAMLGTLQALIQWGAGCQTSKLVPFPNFP